MRPSLLNILFGRRYDAVTLAWRANLRQIGKDATSAQMDHVDSMLSRPLRKAGLVSMIERFNACYPLDLAGSMVPLIFSGPIDVPVGSPAFDVNGWTSNGTSTYIDTGVLPKAQPGGLMAYLRGAQANNTTGFNLIGSGSPGSLTRITGNRDTAFNASAGITAGAYAANTSAALGGTRSGQMVSGCYHTTHNADQLNRLYFNGAGTGVGGGANVHTAGAHSIYVMALNNSGTPLLYLQNNTRIAGYAITQGDWSGAQVAAFYAIFQAFQTTLSRQV